ncbi:hypothetical protein KAI87_02085 [Myxococcota bacterium]|nr:hypothetical protein [Myxococcota bacterium]
MKISSKADTPLVRRSETSETTEPTKSESTTQKSGSASSAKVVFNKDITGTDKGVTAQKSLSAGLSAPSILAQNPTSRSTTNAPIIVTAPYKGELYMGDFVTAGGTKIEMQSVFAHDAVTSSRKIIPADRKLLKWLEKPETGDLVSRNTRNTDNEALKTAINGYAKKSPQVLRSLGIKNIKQLSPVQAIELATQIAMDTAHYDPKWKDEINIFTKIFYIATDPMDSRGVHEYLATEDSETAVCRNYAEIVQSVFDNLKEMQEPKNKSQLVNSYVKQPSGFNHIWNALYTVQPDGVVMTSQTDATWNDPDVQGMSHGDDYTWGPRGIRRYHLVKDLMINTGWRPVEEFTKKFSAWAIGAERRSAMMNDNEPRFPGKNDTAANLSDAFDLLEGPAKTKAWSELTWTAKHLVADYRQAEELKPIPTEYRDDK